MEFAGLEKSKVTSKLSRMHVILIDYANVVQLQSPGKNFIFLNLSIYAIVNVFYVNKEGSC